MNRSLVISRYARTLVKYVQETGQGENVWSEARALSDTLQRLPDLRRMMEADEDVVTSFEKKKLLQSALEHPMSADLSRFLSLLNRNGRMYLVQDILRHFQDLYCQAKGIRTARLVASKKPSEYILQRIRALVRQETGDDVVFNHVIVDPDLIGGFVLDFDDYLLDASVKHQLEHIQQEFMKENSRIS